MSYAEEVQSFRLCASQPDRRFQHATASSKRCKRGQHIQGAWPWLRLSCLFRKLTSLRLLWFIIIVLYAGDSDGRLYPHVLQVPIRMLAGLCVIACTMWVLTQNDGCCIFCFCVCSPGKPIKMCQCRYDGENTDSVIIRCSTVMKCSKSSVRSCVLHTFRKAYTRF